MSDPLAPVIIAAILLGGVVSWLVAGFLLRLVKPAQHVRDHIADTDDLAAPPGHRAP